MRFRVLTGLLVAYALLTEGLQAIIPDRTVELLDLIENLFGLAAGTAIWWYMGDRTSKRRRGRDSLAPRDQD